MEQTGSPEAEMVHPEVRKTVLRFFKQVIEMTKKAQAELKASAELQAVQNNLKTMIPFLV